MYLEVEDNANCEQSVFIRFREHGVPRRVKRVRLYDRRTVGEWCWITGLQADVPTGICPAWAQQVEDSGAGLVWLVWGGIWGIRLKPVDNTDQWDLDSPLQWGEPYLQLADARDIDFDDEAGLTAHNAESESSS